MSAPAFDARATIDLLPFPRLVEALGRAVVELACGRIVCPPRQVVPMPSPGARLLSMTAVAADVVVHKLITVMPGNAARGLPTIDGRLGVLDADSGRITMTLDAASATGRRTAALTMLGIATLAARPPRTVLVFGTGVQARHHVEAFAACFPTAVVFVVGREASSAARFVAALAGAGSEAHSAANTATNTAANAVALARASDASPVDVVVTCTTSRDPVYGRGRHGDHAPLVVATGSFEPEAAEIEADFVRDCRIYVDDAAGAAHEAGDLIRAGIPAGSIAALADALASKPVPRDRPILFKTVGCAAWDLAAARVASAGLVDHP